MARYRKTEDGWERTSGGVQVIDNLESTSATSALSANQGRELKQDLTHNHYTKTEVDDLSAYPHIIPSNTYNIAGGVSSGSYTMPNDGLLIMILVSSATDARNAQVTINGVNVAMISGNPSKQIASTVLVRKGDVVGVREGVGGTYYLDLVKR